MSRQFADTSVLLGYLDGHPVCVRHHEANEWLTTHAHVFEVYSVLRSRPEVLPEQSDEVLDALLPFAVAIPHGAIRPAAEVRQRLRAQNKDCSYIDALGYGVAQSLGIELLIGDASFEGVDGATRVKIESRKPSRRARK